MAENFCGDSWDNSGKNAASPRPGEFFLGFQPFRPLWHAQKVPHFRNRQDESFHMVLTVKKNCLTKMSRRRGFSKKRRFLQFSIAAPKKFQMAVNRTILILEPLPMAHLKAYVPNFPKHIRKRSQSLKLWVLDLSEVRSPQI